MYSGWKCVEVFKVCVCVLFRCGSHTCSVHTSHASPFLHAPVFSTRWWTALLKRITKLWKGYQLLQKVQWCTQHNLVLGSPAPRLKKDWDWTGPRLLKTGVEVCLVPFMTCFAFFLLFGYVYFVTKPLRTLGMTLEVCAAWHVGPPSLSTLIYWRTRTWTVRFHFLIFVFIILLVFVLKTESTELMLIPKARQ